MTKKLQFILFLSIIFLLLFKPAFSQNTITIGTGTQNVGYPFYTYYHDSKTQMLYTASEMIAAGSNGGAISSVAFDVAQIASQTMNNFSIKIKETSASSLSGYETSGLTTVYSSAYSVSSTGWNSFNFTTPFAWNGTSNIIIEICFDNTSYTSNTNVRSSSAIGKVWHKHNDGATGCSFTSGSGQSYRPNIKFTILASSSNNFAATEISAPTNGTSANASMPVSIKVSNQGSSAQTGYTVKYSIDNGSTWTSKVISTTLASYASTTVNFTGTDAADMSAAGVYQCIGVVSRTGDTIQDNDTVRANIAICGSPYSGSLTIGNSTGDDFPDINSAISALKLCGISGAINLKIKPGYYTEQVRIGPITGITSATPLTIESYTGNADDVVFSYGATSSSDNYVFKLDTCNYVNIKNLTIKATGSGNNIKCIDLYASNNCTIEGNSIISKETNYSLASTSLIYASSNANFTGLSVINNSFTKGAFGIYFKGNYSYTCQNTTISNNVFINNLSSGIALEYANNYSISSNDFQQNTSLGKGIQSSYSTGSQIIERNKIITNNHEGILLQNCSGSSSDPLIIKNNFIHQILNNYNGINVSSCSYANIFNNSVHTKGTNNYSACLFIGGGSYNSVKNNNLISSAGGFAYRVNGASGILESNYNNLYTTGSNLAYWDGNISNLAALQTASNKDANSINSSVSFYTDDNLHIIGSTLNGLGTPIASVTDDFDGETRNATTPDIGADEYSLFQNDAGLTEFVNIVNACPGTAQNISVKLNNFGLSGIANVGIGWSVNGNPQTNYTWTGLLGLLNNTNVTLGSYSFDADSLYEIKAWVNTVNLVTDSNAINDTVVLNDYHTSLSGGNYQIGSSSSADYYSIQSAIDAMNEYGICGPIVFNIESGIYTNNYIINDITGSSSANTITFQSLNGDTTTTKFVHNSTNSNEAYVFSLDGASYIHFKQLGFNTQGGNYGKIFKVINSSNYFSIDSCMLIGSNSTNVNNYNNIIQCQNSEHISITNSTLKDGSDAINITGNNSNYLHRVDLINNNIIGYIARGIYTSYTSDTLYIINNNIEGKSSAIFVNSDNGKIFISDNNIRINTSTTGLDGIRINNHNTSGISSNVCNISNNFIYINSSYSNGPTAINLYYSKYNNVYYNTVKLEGSNVYPNYALYIYNSSNSNIKNNILDAGNNKVLYYRYSSDIASSNNNSFYSTNTTPFYYSYSNYTFAQYKTSSNRDGNSIWGQPVYLNSDDLHIYDIALNNHGTPISGITTDIDGETRSSSSPDIGADEYSIPAIDIAINKINTPGLISGTGSNEVRVAIRNMGTSNIVIDSLHYSIDNGTTTSIQWTGNLTPLSVDSFILLGTENYSAGTHSIKVWSTHPNSTTDLNHDNDTLERSFTAQAMPQIIVSPLTISDTTIACDDSVIVAVKIKNTGNAILNYTIDSASGTNSQLQVVILKYGVYSGNYNTIMSALGETFTNYSAVFSDASNVSSLQTDISGKDVIIIPYYSSSSYTSLYSSFAPTLQNFVSNGGSVIFAGQSNYNYLNNTGLWYTLSSMYSTSNGSSITKFNHSITDNITSANLYNNSDYFYYYTNTNMAGYIPLLKRYSNNIAGFRQYGNGYVFNLGFRYRYTNNTAQQKLISNSLEFIHSTNNHWLSASPLSGSVNVGDSTIVNVKLNSLGYNAGVYTSELTINSNDIDIPTVVIPCTLTVVGTPNIASQTTSINFNSQYNNIASYDSVQVYNDGCGNLLISNITTSNAAYTVESYEDTLTPGDSAWVIYKFLPTITGAYAATSTVSSNTTDYTLYLSGNSTQAPDITVTPSSLNITIPNCNDSIITNIQMQNSGGGTLTATVTAAADSAHIIILTYGSYSSRKNNMINSFGQNFSEYDYMETSTTTGSSLQNYINSFNANVIVIPDIESSSTGSYGSLATVLQTFTTNGGTVIFGGGYWDDIFTQTGLISATRINNNSYANLNVQNTNDPLTLNFPTIINTYNEYINYFTFTGTGITSLLKYNGNDVAVRKAYGSGQVIVLGHYYYNLPTNYTYHQQLLSNSIKSAATCVDWMSYTSSTANLSAGSTAVKNITFKSEGLATGTYTTNLSIQTNSPTNPTVLVPCTLTVQNQMANGVDLGNDTTSCGSIVLDAGAGFSSYAWNTGNTTQTITAVSSGTYSVTVGSGGPCSSSDTISVIVVNASSAAISGLPNTGCSADASIALTGTPTGGVFSGPGMTGNIFSPAAASTGTHTITYTYTGTTCSSSTTEQIIINLSPTVSFSGLSSSYCPTDPASMLTGAPSGGTFSGTGVSGNNFYPSIAGLGTHNVMYTYAAGGCSNTDTNSTFIGNSTINITINIPQSSFCLNDNSVTISATPAGGNLSGDGITGNTFDPVIAGVGTHYIKYTVSSATSCDALDSVLVTVLSAPTGVSIFNLPSSFCNDAAAVTISGYPAGGVFSGYGMTGSTFSPANANIGTHYISYTITGTNGCSTTAVDSTTVLAPPTITFTNMQSNYCENDEPIAIVVTPTGGTLTGTGLVGNTFNPSTAGIGTHTVYYSYTDANSCSNNESFNIVIYSSPSSTINSITSSFCATSPAVNVSGTPSGGVFSGNGVVGNTFSPTIAGAGTHYVKYKITDNNGCTDIDSTTATVDPVHTVNAGNDVSIPYNTSTQLSGLISGGNGNFTFSWTPTSSVVNPSQLSSSTTNLTTSTAFTLNVLDNVNSCSNSDEVIVTITGGVLSGNLTASASTICEGEYSNLQALGAGGAGTNYTYSWTSNPAGFTSSIANPIVNPSVSTTYNCDINDGTNTITESILISVNASPNAVISNLDTVYCTNDAIATISVSPSGGTLTGGGISGYTFNPSTAPLGQNVIIYSITGANGCDGADTINVIVGQIPSVYAGNDTLLPCSNNGLLLGQQPISGVSYQWIPTSGLTNANIANPALTINTNINYTITATHDNSGCSNSDNISIQVTGTPVAVASNDTTVCTNSTVDLWASGGSTYFWSNGAIGNTNSVTPTVSTLYYVVVTDAGCSSMDTVWVMVNDPMPNLGADTSLCGSQSYTLDAGSGFSSYNWSNGSTSQTITVDTTGIGYSSMTIDVDVYDNIGCNGKDTVMVTFINCIGLNDIDNNSFVMSVYPNPSSGLFTIHSNETSIKELNLEILDINGRIILQKQLINNNGSITDKVDLSNQPSGVYLVRLSNGKLVKTFKVVIN